MHGDWDLWESLRMFFFIYIPIFYDILDEFIFILKSFLIFIGIFVLLELAIKILQKAGLSSKYYIIARITTFMAIPLFSILNFCTYIKIGPNELGINEYQVNQILILLFYSIYIPIAVFLYYKINNAKKMFNNKKPVKIFNILIILLISTVVERLIALSYSYYFGTSLNAIIINFCFKLSYTFGLFILLFKYPDFLEFIGVYFDIKSIYLINNKGDTIYRFDFQSIDHDLPPNSRDLVLGGFIYAISRGLKHIVDVPGELETLKIGNVTIFLTHGKYIFGTLFATENTPILIQKLVAFVKNVENKYRTILENEESPILKFKDLEKDLNILVSEIFR